MDFRLSRLILINSYCKRQLIEIVIDGHVTINGRNGAGKTTLLRLLPMFLGEAPSRVIRGDANKDNFTQHFLHTTASYIVYEYERRGQKVLSVIHADGQKDSAVYRFIDSPYREDMFKNGDALVQCSDLQRHLQNLGVFCTPRLTLAEYRQIIQNNSTREHRQLAARFSFVGSGGRLTHIERVVTAILQRATTFYDLRRMIVSSIQNEQDVFSMNTGKHDLLKWIAEHDAHQEVMAKSSVMSALNESDAARLAVVGQYPKLRAQFDLLHAHIESCIRGGEDDRSKLKAEKAKLQTDLDAKQQALNDRKSAADSTHRSATTTLATLDARKSHYDERKAEASCVQVESIPSLEAEQQAAKSQLADIEQSIKSESEIFDRMERDARDQAAQQTNIITSERSEAHAAHGVRIESLAGQQANELADLRSNHETAQSARTATLSAKETELATKREQMKHAQGDTALVAALKTHQAAHLDLERTLQAALESAQAGQAEWHDAKNAFDDGERQLNESRIALEKAEGELKRLTDLKDADAKTLIGFLREHKPDWAATIGRIVPDDVLLRADLEPRIAEGLSLYGVDVNLDRLPASRLSNDDLIKQEIDKAQDRVTRSREWLNADEASLQKLSERLARAKNSQDQCTVAVSKAKSDIETSAQKQRSIETRIEYTKNEQRALLEKEIRLLEEQVAEIKAELAAAAESNQQRMSALSDIHRQAVQAAKTDLGQRLKNLEARTAELDATLNARLASVAKDRETCLKEKGISPDTSARLRGEIKARAEIISKATALRPFVAEYRSWRDGPWSKRSELVAEQAAAAAALSEIKAQVETALKERYAALTNAEAKIAATEEQIDRYNRETIACANHISTIQNWQADKETLQSGFDPAITLGLLVDRKAALQRDLRAHTEAITRGVDEIRRAMTRAPGTRVDQFHTQTVRELGAPREGREYEWLPSLRNWFDAEHITNKNSLIQIAKTIAMNISSFSRTLDNFDANIKSFSLELNNSLGEGTAFDTITDVKAHISTDIDGLKYYKAVTAFNDEYTAWHESADSSLPPARFIDAAKEVARVIGDGKIVVTDPAELVHIAISASVNGYDIRATNEKDLETASSNGLSYIILCIVMIGFVNRIRRKEKVVIPWPVDELKDLDFDNASTLLDLLSRNNVQLTAAFPDVDTDLAEIFTYNYKILPGRQISIVTDSVDDEDDADKLSEAAHV